MSQQVKVRLVWGSILAGNATCSDLGFRGSFPLDDLPHTLLSHTDEAWISPGQEASKNFRKTGGTASALEYEQK
jgi:hypothetical protein